MTQLLEKELVSEPKGDWIQTYNGHKFYPLSPEYSVIDIKDIGHSLSLQCRYTGHCNYFYSVAEHCCHLYDYAKKHKPEFAMWALLHDATEAYLSDVPRPIKPMIPEYKVWETRLMSVIATRFGLRGKEPEYVKEIDFRILKDEYDQIMNKGPKWDLPEKGLGVKIEGWNFARAKVEFMYRFYEEKSLDGRY